MEHQLHSHDSRDLAHLSFLRPNPAASPVTSDTSDFHLARAELWILGWLEDQGYQPDVYTDIDFHNHGLDFSQYKCLVLNTHPEYWSLQMWTNVQSFLAGGGSLLYLGGNGIYEDAEYSIDQTGMIFLAGVEGGDRTIALFRNLKPGGEQVILGVSFDGGLYGTHAPYQVRQAGHPFFHCTGLSNGDDFGATGLNTHYGNGEASGWEVDTTNTVKFDGSSTSGSGLPSGLVVLATGLNRWTGSEWVGADMTYYDHPGGGFVLSTGSIMFG